MRRTDINGIWGGVLMVVAAGLIAFTVHGLSIAILDEHGGPYLVMGAVMYVGIAGLLGVIGVRLIRSSIRARQLQ